MEWETGNLDALNKSYPERRSWILGSLIKESNLRHSEVCAVNWLRLSKGTKRVSRMNLDKQERTLAILISGKLKINFENGENATFSGVGDYWIYEAAPHEVEGLEESLIVTLRWKE